MKKVFPVAGIVICALSLQLAGCKVDPSLDNGLSVNPEQPVSFQVPSGWPAPVYTFQNNALTQEGFALGRKLFYDTRLSRDNTISCGSCHQQFAGFSMLDHPQSHGIDGKFGTRNAPALSNIAWEPAYFWDGNEPNLENFPIHPITNPVEMDDNMTNIVSKLSGNATYRQMFTAAFGSSDITAERIFKAIAQFQAAMISNNSRYDKYMRGESGGNFTAQELSGLNLFRAKCASCHQEPLFTDYSYRNNGLEPSPVFKDSGRAFVTKLAGDVYKFKVPSLRNVDLSRPYEHDGRFNTLEEAVEHYRTGIYNSSTLDTALNGGIQMTDAEKADIISFLKTLSDETYIKDPRFAEPVAVQ